jgi:hypothetical protein
VRDRHYTNKLYHRVITEIKEAVTVPRNLDFNVFLAELF